VDALLSSKEGTMSRYHFELANGHRLQDPTGLECNSDQDARAAAEIIARQMADELDHTGRCVIVVDEDGKEIYKVPI
jgi:hypothetical protein